MEKTLSILGETIAADDRIQCGWIIISKGGDGQCDHQNKIRLKLHEVVSIRLLFTPLKTSYFDKDGTDWAADDFWELEEAH